MQKSWNYLALPAFTSQKLTKLSNGLVRGTNIVLTRLGIVHCWKAVQTDDHVK
jgi:hypothetical protein